MVWFVDTPTSSEGRGLDELTPGYKTVSLYMNDHLSDGEGDAATVEGRAVPTLA